MSASPEVGVVVLAASITVLCTIGILANIVLIVFYVRRPIMRTSTNVYLVHKAASDLVSLLTFPIHLIEILKGWNLGNWPCKFVVSLESLCMIASANIIFAMVYDRLTAVTRPGDGLERTVSKARNHVIAAWVYSLLLFLPVVAAGWTVMWPPGDTALRRPICGYQWPAGDKYHTMYFGSLLVILYLGHYLIYACFIYITWKRVQQSKEVFLARYDTVQRCRAVASVIATNFIAYLVYWAQHVYNMVFLRDDQTHVPHIPSGLVDPLSVAASLAVYIAAGSNLFLCSVSMDQWKSVAKDALHCRCGAGSGVRPLNTENAVAVIDVTAAADDPQDASNSNHTNDPDNDSMMNSNNLQHSDDEPDVQEITL